MVYSHVVTEFGGRRWSERSRLQPEYSAVVEVAVGKLVDEPEAGDAVEVGADEKTPKKNVRKFALRCIMQKWDLVHGE